MGKMLDVFYTIVSDGWAWVGFDATVDDLSLWIGEGRVGRTARPLVLGDEISGGWYFREEVIVLSPTDTRVDIVLDHTTDALLVVLRSDDTTETYDGDLFELMIPLLRKEGDEWYIARPRWNDEDA